MLMALLRKMNSVQILIKETSKSIHILGISEMHLTEEINDEVAVYGYNFVRMDHKTGLGGGVGCFIREDLSWQRCQDIERDGIEAIWLEIFIKDMNSILVCIVYRPPNSSKHLDKSFDEKFDDMISISVNE